jgi:tetratricopeptide (TPR) repeat protein
MLGTDMLRRLWRTAALPSLMVLLLALGLCVRPAEAQLVTGQDRPRMLAEQDQLFQRMLREPGNLDVAFAYAAVSAKLGDNEAAATALERMLLFNPNLPWIDLELGALYLRMGSFDLARDYFNKALAANPPPDVRNRANRYLGEIAAQQSPSRFEGYVFFGAQYQTDANVAPGSPLIHSPVGDVLLSSQFVKRPDTNIFGSGGFLYTYDLGTQSRDAIEVTGVGFMNHYFRTQRLDLAFGEVTVGPRLNLASPDDRVSRLSVKPYAIANEVGLGEAQYFYTGGVGLENTATLWDASNLSLYAYTSNSVLIGSQIRF